MSKLNEAKEAAREYIKLIQTNKIELAGTIVDHREILGGEKIRDGVPMTDLNGEVMRYPTTYMVRISFTGGEIETKLDKVQFEKIKAGDIVLLRGRLGMVRNFGQDSVGWVFDSAEVL